NANQSKSGVGIKRSGACQLVFRTMMEFQRPTRGLQSPQRNPVQTALIWLGLMLLSPVIMVYFGIVILVMLALSPVLVPVITAIQNRRRRKAAETFRCTRCSNLLGAQSLHLANEEYGKKLKKFHRRFSRFAVPPFVQTCDAICTACAMRYGYRRKQRTFVSEATMSK